MDNCATPFQQILHLYISISYYICNKRAFLHLVECSSELTLQVTNMVVLPYSVVHYSIVVLVNFLVLSYQVKPLIDPGRVVKLINCF